MRDRVGYHVQQPGPAAAGRLVESLLELGWRLYAAGSYAASAGDGGVVDVAQMTGGGIAAELDRLLVFW